MNPLYVAAGLLAFAGVVAAILSIDRVASWVDRLHAEICEENETNQDWWP